jgi:membrane fusion protein, macrolide-specific efflux system
MADEFNEPVEETQEIIPTEPEPAAADITEETPAVEAMAETAEEKPIKEKKVKPPKPPKQPKPPKEPKPPKPPKTPKTPAEKARTKKMIKRTVMALVILLIVAGIAGAASWYLFFRDTSVNVTVTMVLRGEVKDMVNATGKVEANQMVPLFALQDDKVSEILVKEGDTVTAGQNILKLETGGYVTSTTAGKVVSVDVKVNDKVIGLTTPFTTTTPSATTPTTPTTPATTPTTPTTTTGVTKNPNPTQLASVADMDPTYVVANVDETDISKVKIGQKADMVLDSYPGKTIKGEVVEVGLVATVTQTGGTAFPVKIKITEAKNVDLRIGMSADTEIVVETKDDALRVPVSAVTTDSGKDAVYIVKESKAERTTIKIGLLSGEYYEVLAGITEGEEVVVKGVDKLKGAKTATVKVTRQ